MKIAELTQEQSGDLIQACKMATADSTGDHFWSEVSKRVAELEGEQPEPDDSVTGRPTQAS